MDQNSIQNSPVFQLMGLAGQIPMKSLCEITSEFLVSKRASQDLVPPGNQKDSIVVNTETPPFSLSQAGAFRHLNAYHAACLESSAYMTVGFGFHKKADKKILDTLDPLCGNEDFGEMMLSVAENMYEFGAGFIEVVREDPTDSRSKIRGMHFYPSNIVYRTRAPETDKGPYMQLAGYRLALPTTSDVLNIHDTFGDQMVGSYIPTWGDTGNIAPFGWAKEFIEAHQLDGRSAETITEMIEFRLPRIRPSLYPIPNWISAMSNMQMMLLGMQHESEYFWNRGVPLWMLILTGAKVDQKDWDRIHADLSRHVGPGNAYKGHVLNVDDPNMKVQLELLAQAETTRSRYLDNSDAIAHHILTAHRVPPRVVGIQMGGRIGAVNESVTDLWLFQRTKIFGAQKRLSRILATTLGNKEYANGIGLSPEDFTGPEDRSGNGFAHVLEDENMEALQGLGRMKDPAAMSGRDPADGPLKNGQERARRASSAS